MPFKLVFKNLKSFITGTPLAFLVVVLLEIFSAIVIILSYGIVRNIFTEQKQETYLSKSYRVEKYDDEYGYYYWDDSEEFLKGFDTLLDTFGNNIKGAGVFGKLVLDDTEYTCCVTYYSDKDAYMELNSAYSYEDYSSGKRVVAVSGNKYKTSEGSTITIGGEDYLVVESGGSRLCTFAFTYNAFPDNMSFSNFMIDFKEIPTHKEVDKLNEFVHEAFGYDFITIEPDIPDLLVKQFNMISLSMCAAIMLIVVFNCMIVYMYIFQKRQRWLAVVKLCGCKTSECAAIFIMETMLVTMLSCAVGAVMTNTLLIPHLKPYYPAFEAVYTPQSYLLLFAAYAAVSLLMLEVNVVRYVSGTVDSMRKGAV